MRGAKWYVLGAAILLLLGSATLPATDAPSGLAFRAAGEGLYEFNTGEFRGRLKVDGKYQGLYPLVDAASGADLTNPPGVFSPYRVFSGNERFGNAARDWTTATRLLPDGAVEVRWPAADDHPLEIAAVYRWNAPGTLDLRMTVVPKRDLPRFELFQSSYFTAGFRASVYVKGDGLEGQRRFVPADRPPQSPGGYVMFPRDDDAVRMIGDGRWGVGSNPVDWAIERKLAAPIALRRDAAQDLTVAMMAPPDDCFAVGLPWNPATPEAGGYRSIYLSLFGKDLRAGQAARARCRMIVGRGLSDEDILRRYAEYLREP